MRILFVADLVGRPGRQVARALLPGLRAERAVDVVIANGENLAAGFGVTPSLVTELLGCGVDVITSGNHIWDRRDGVELLEEEPRLLRPANYPSGNPGSGTYVLQVEDRSIAVVNLQGRAFMPDIDDPFRVGRTLVDDLRAETNIIVIDFHAEATAEKLAFAHFMDGLVSAVVGTHTHVPTADARVLPGGTAYVTDLGMTGSHAGVIGFQVKGAVQRSLLGRRIRLELAEGELRFQGALIDIDEASGHATSIERVDLSYEREQ
ncbi:MAG: TIGR00282 family metallophosphoesterase [Gemmatimonadota bacterium]|nr:MAG: TIGR00282 family metallophosphoesterase [Gemmatimonadota bacterium]